MIIGYARVSTEEQHLDAQISALEAIGAERIFAEKVSGTKKASSQGGPVADLFRSFKGPVAKIPLVKIKPPPLFRPPILP